MKLNFGSRPTRDILLATWSTPMAGADVIFGKAIPCSKSVDFITYPGNKMFFVWIVSCETVLFSLDFESSAHLPYDWLTND